MREQNNKKFMPEIIGQKLAKKKLEFLAKGHAATGIMPHLMFVGMKGAGKTFIAEALKHHMKSKDDPSKDRKDFMTINCSTIKSLPQFANSLLIPHIHGKEITVLFDEASELPKDVEMALLTILNVTEQNTTQFSYEDYDMNLISADRTSCLQQQRLSRCSTLSWIVVSVLIWRNTPMMTSPRLSLLNFAK